MLMTNNEGVDVVLDNLDLDKPNSSINCLAPNGRYLEVGKYTSAKDSTLSKNLFFLVHLPRGWRGWGRGHCSTYEYGHKDPVIEGLKFSMSTKSLQMGSCSNYLHFHKHN